ncbi:MAG: 3-hydroxyacyl-ACP dehydratase FabZ [Sphaerochaetaceae bacterium]|jgi:3-hydroxyacyl-[acyl-carrier-protein] dehydratase|nr:3-hydroxyacyl-ACP dehydratase FabZ [Sphaerochaetaceae bacterium]NLO60588.1 3-hydroxyacyl-ACP dehydratase FabZ [Spirochaetales bacterium]MDD2405991.1 3-hydroxyacyl-ACP dehydratase FabZ [Sphaerochaetaceae bacterium]MDD3670014.1 3-hydroxyacyl-ACP dehydratase FabZ [Sphaerochaetaceae bacterium]MDD4259835.1 3-hydroxyacyl-ACP dehydratase FabZ [Sphaerochaetaceae bacterium]
MKDEYQEIKELLPHREPFLLVDRLVAVDEHGCIAEHLFRGDEQFFKGHFPHYPVVPGVLLIEMMAQSGGAGLREFGILPSDSLFMLGTVEKAKFRHQVRPGNLAVIEITNLRVSQVMIRQSGIVKVNGRVAAEATWMCLVGSRQ